VIASETPATTESHTAHRALDWARRWDPTAAYALTGVTDGEATVLVEVDGDIRFVRYRDLDSGGFCPYCGAPCNGGSCVAR
jgi:hypothetical protein